MLDTHANLPVAFMENRGQRDEPVRYYAAAPDLPASPQSPAHADAAGEARGPADGTDMPDAGAIAEAAAQRPLEAMAVGLRSSTSTPTSPWRATGTCLGVTNYLRGDDPPGWHIDLAGYARVVGTTQSDDLPTTPGVHDRTFNGAVEDRWPLLPCHRWPGAQYTAVALPPRTPSARWTCSVPW